MFWKKTKQTKQITIEDIRTLIQNHSVSKEVLLSCVQKGSPKAQDIRKGKYDFDDVFNILTSVSTWVNEDGEKDDWHYPASDTGGGFGHREYASNEVIFDKIHDLLNEEIS